MAKPSLIVTISANISDLSRNLDAAEKRLVKAGDRLEKVGSDLSLKVTAPLIALSAAFAKSAAEDAASVDKMSRAFGAATGQMDSFIKVLMKSVPATDDQLRTLAASTDTLFKSMGIAPQKAMAMSQSVLKLAGDLAAYNHVSLETATDAVEKAMAGRTKGLVALNVVVTDADVKAKAYQMGLAKVGSELSSTAKAQATLAAIIERSGAQQGEAGRTYGDSANALARLKQSADAVADSFGAVVLPTFVNVTDAAGDMLKALADLPDAAKTAIVGIGAFAAAAGPLVYVGGSIVKVYTLARAAMMGLVATQALSGLGALIASVTSLGEALTVTGIAAGALATAFAPLLIAGGVAAAIGAIGYAIFKSGESARHAAEQVENYKSAVAGINNVGAARTAAKAIAGRLLALQNSPLDLNGDPMHDAHERVVRDQQIATLQQELIAANARTRALRAPGGGGTPSAPPGAVLPTGKDPLADLEDYANRLGRLYQLTDAKGRPIVGLTAQITQTIDALTAALARQKNQWSETAVKIREALESLTKYGQATLLPGLQGKLPSLTYAQAIAKMGNAGAGVPGLNTTMANITTADIRGPAGSNVSIDKLAPPAFKQVSLQERMVQQLATLPEQFASSLGQFLGPVLARMGGGTGGAIGAALGGGIGGAVGKAVAGGIPALAGKGIGAAIGSAALPVVGTIVGSLAGNLIGGAIGKLFGGGGPSPAERAAEQLQHLALAAQKVQEAISGLPEGIKIQQYRFDATTVDALPAPGGGGQTGGGTANGPIAPGGTANYFAAGSIVVNGVTDAASLFRSISDYAESQIGRSGSFGLQLAVDH